MRYVILRDDDTNAFTPVDCLEKLYRPFLDRGLPVNLAVIPDVRLDTLRTDGLPEQFLFAKNGSGEITKPVGDNRKLVDYVRDNPGFHVAQHGYDHSLFEFDSRNTGDVCDRLELGTRLLMDAGFPRPQTFVAPYDKFSAVSLRQTAKRFQAISTGWFELKRLPFQWWPRYTRHKIARHPHWRLKRTLFLSHPGCLLSSQRPRDIMIDTVRQSVNRRQLTVLVTHWWEYFPAGKADESFIQILHETAAWLAREKEVKVITFDDVIQGAVPLN